MIINWTYGEINQDVQQAAGGFLNWSTLAAEAAVGVVGYVRAGQIATPGIRYTNGCSIGQVASVGIRTNVDGANGQAATPGTRKGQVAQ